MRKARLSNDPGYYKLAEQCALVMEAASRINPMRCSCAGMPPRPCTVFATPKAIARQLVAQREYVLDHALLGDALMEQGRRG